VPVPAPTPIVYAALGDSITAGGQASQIGKTDYVSLIGAALGAQTTDLGIGGQFSGPEDTYYGTVHIVYAGVLAAEVPGIPLNANLVTLYIGTNDMYLAFSQDLADYSNAASVAQATDAYYQANIAGIIAGIKARVPQARIVVATVPNYGWQNGHNNVPLALASTAMLADSFKATLIATGLTVVDLLCEPGMYDEANFAAPGNPHPDDAGHAIIAHDFLAQIAHPTAPGHCQYENP
jgi:lysophospholipase L1-like esterase